MEGIFANGHTGCGICTFCQILDSTLCKRKADNHSFCTSQEYSSTYMRPLPILAILPSLIIASYAKDAIPWAGLLLSIAASVGSLGNNSLAVGCTGAFGAEAGGVGAITGGATGGATDA